MTANRQRLPDLTEVETEFLRHNELLREFIRYCKIAWMQHPVPDVPDHQAHLMLVWLRDQIEWIEHRNRWSDNRTNQNDPNQDHRAT